MVDPIDSDILAEFRSEWAPDFGFWIGVITDRVNGEGRDPRDALNVELERNNLGDVGWNWDDIVGSAEGGEKRTFAALVDECLEGLMAVDLRYETAPESSSGFGAHVYIERLTVAPWNRVPPNGQQRYRGVGRALLSTAIFLSFDYDFEGKVALHSLPHSRGFYERYGLTTPNGEPGDGELAYYELSSDRAAELAGI